MIIACVGGGREGGESCGAGPGRSRAPPAVVILRPDGPQARACRPLCHPQVSIVDHLSIANNVREVIRKTSQSV